MTCVDDLYGMRVALSDELVEVIAKLNAMAAEGAIASPNTVCAVRQRFGELVLGIRELNSEMAHWLLIEAQANQLREQLTADYERRNSDVSQNVD